MYLGKVLNAGFIVLAGFWFNYSYADPIILQSTTSTQNSGLLDDILPKFQLESGYEVRVVAVGTGQALSNARNGDGDVLLVHSKTAEETFVKEGWGIERFDVMYNDFVIVGPSEDPANIKGFKEAPAALNQIAASYSLFISRGDDSGTHRAERRLWEETKVDILSASGSWYLEVGAGMGATLNAASKLGAYALTDRATWLSFKNKVGMVVFVEGDSRLFNQYGVVAVNPKRHRNINVVGAETFVKWLTGPAGQTAISDFRLEGRQLFFANATK